MFDTFITLSTIGRDTNPFIMKYRAIIIDDEHLAREMLQEMIAIIYPSIEIVKNCSSLLQGVEYIKSNQVDIIFLDIEMPLHKGNEIVHFLKPIPCPIIFTSAYYQEHLFLKGLENSIFLNKPINLDELKKALDWVILLRKK